MGLFDRFTKPKWQHQNSDVRCNAIRTLDDQQILSEIAKNDSAWHVRKAAAERITDEQVLKDIVLNDTDIDVIWAATERIEDESILKDAAIGYTGENLVRRNGVRHSSFAFLKYIAKRISHEANLIEIARNAKDSVIRCEVIERIDSQQDLAYVAKNDSYALNRKMAVRNIDDEKVLAYVAKNDSDAEVSKAAAERITDQSVLADIAKNAKSHENRQVAKYFIRSDELRKEVESQEDPKFERLAELENDYQKAAYESSSFNHSSEYGPYYEGMMIKAKNMVEECRKLGEFGKADYYQKQYDDYKRRYDDFKQGK